MRIGVPKEVKVHEYRVGMTPASVREAVSHDHQVLVEHDAAARQGLTDQDQSRERGIEELVVGITDGPCADALGGHGHRL